LCFLGCIGCSHGGNELADARVILEPLADGPQVRELPMTCPFIPHSPGEDSEDFLMRDRFETTSDVRRVSDLDHGAEAHEVDALSVVRLRHSQLALARSTGFAMVGDVEVGDVLESHLPSAVCAQRYSKAVERCSGTVWSCADLLTQDDRGWWR